MVFGRAGEPRPELEEGQVPPGAARRTEAGKPGQSWGPLDRTGLGWTDWAGLQAEGMYLSRNALDGQGSSQGDALSALHLDWGRLHLRCHSHRGA